MHKVIASNWKTGVTGILCSRFCHDVVLTDHNEEVLKARTQQYISLLEHLVSLIFVFLYFNSFYHLSFSDTEQKYRASCIFWES